MLQYTKYIKTNLNKDELFERIDEVIPCFVIEGEYLTYSSRVELGREFSKHRRAAKKRSNYYLRQINDGYIIEPNSKNKNYSLPKAKLNLVENECNVDLDICFNFFHMEKVIILIVLLSGYIYSIFEVGFNIIMLLFLLILLSIIYLPGLIKFKSRADKITEMIESAVQ